MRWMTGAVLLALAFAPMLGVTADENTTPLVPDPLQDLTDPVAPVVDPENEYIVGFYELPTERGEYEGFPILKVDADLKYFLVHAPVRPLLDAAVLQDDRTRYIEVNNPGGRQLFFTPDDALYNDAGHYGSKKIGAEAAWDRTTGTTAVLVGMVDSGINAGHEDLQGARFLGGYDFVNGDADPEDTGGSCSYHGSHTTGTAGATINNGLGIAGMSQHSVLSSKIFHRTGGGPFGCSAASDTGIADALKFVGDQGGHVSSNSWGGGPDSSTINSAIQHSHDLGVHHVAAAGNGGCNNCVGNPWNDKPSIVTIVTGTDSNDNAYSGNSKGPEVDVSAPGVSIISSTGGGSNAYSTYTGTSMATPHVAGTAALIKALEPTWGFTEIDQRLKDTAVDLGSSGHDDTFGYGRINADAATNGIGGPQPDPQCSDGIDNDSDGLTDYPNDPGCDSSSDDDETDPAPAQCNDGIDNDGDGLTDFPDDPGCSSSDDDDETDAPTPTNAMHVHAIDHFECSGGRPSNRDICIDVDIFDDVESGVDLANVCVTATRNSDGTQASGCGDTDATGRVTFNWAGAGRDNYTTCVDTLAKTDWSWDTAADHANGGNCGTDDSN